MESMSKSTLSSRFCYVCGRDNKLGLNTAFLFDGLTVEANFVPQAEHCGFDNVVHGGILFAIADEAMMQLIHACGIRAVTAEVLIKFKRPAFVGDKIMVRGERLRCRGRLVECGAAVFNESGEIICNAEGKFLRYSDNNQFKKSWL